MRSSAGCVQLNYDLISDPIVLTSLALCLQDADNNTILILLAELRPGVQSLYCPEDGHPDFMGAALRMARIYHERYPFILEWSNAEGKTALHVAALKGNEELVRVRTYRVCSLHHY